MKCRKDPTDADSESEKPILPDWLGDSENLIMEANQMEAYTTKVSQTSKAEGLGNVERKSWLFPDKSEMFIRKKHSFKSFGPSLVMFAKECICQAKPTTLKLFPIQHTMSPYKVTSVWKSYNRTSVSSSFRLILINNPLYGKNGYRISRNSSCQTCARQQRSPSCSMEPFNCSSIIGETGVRTCFGIVGNSPVDILLVASFIDWNIRRTLLLQRKFLSWHSMSVQILSRNISAAVQLHLSGKNWREVPVATICAARQTVVPPQSLACVLKGSCCDRRNWACRNKTVSHPQLKRL